MPADRPKGRAKKYIADLDERQQALVAFLDDFKTKLGMYDEAASTIDECMAVLSQYEEVVGAARVPMLISSARDARRGDGSVLEYGPYLIVVWMEMIFCCRTQERLLGMRNIGVRLALIIGWGLRLDSV